LAGTDNVAQMREQWYRNAALTNHTVSMSGKSGSYGTYASLAYTGQQDPAPGTRNNTYQLNARQDYQAGKHVSLYLITNVRYREQGSQRAIAPDNRFVPYALFTDAQGTSLDHSWLFWSDSLRQSYETA